MRTKDRVRQVAIQRFAAAGFQATGIRDLATHAGISVASLYQHMVTKQDLLESIMAESLERLSEDADTVLAEVDDPLDGIAGLTMLHVMAHARRRDRTVVVDTEVRSLEDDRRQRVVELRDAYERRWRACLDRAADADLVDGTNLTVSRLAILDMLTGVSGWYQPDGADPLEDLAVAHVDLVLSMLGAHRGGRRVRATDCAIPSSDWFLELVARPFADEQASAVSRAGRPERRRSAHPLRESRPGGAAP